MKRLVKRGTSALLALALALSLLPAQVLAEELPAPAASSPGQLAQPEFLPAEDGAETADPSSEDGPEAAEESADPASEDGAGAAVESADPASEDEPETEEPAPEPVEFPAPAAAETTEDGFQYTVADGAATVTLYTGSAAALAVPDALGGAPVTAIGASAFKGNAAITSVQLPGSLTSIGREAFHACSSLTSVTIPAGVSTWGELAFCNCTALSSVTLPEGLSVVGDRTFQGCTALTAVHIPSTLTSVTSSYGVFRDSGLREVTFGAGITRIARGLFRSCGALTGITLPDTVTAIDEEAFNGCGSLRSVKLSDNLQSIGLDAFTGCGNLDAITLPDSLTSIGRNAFNACSALTSVTIPAGVSTWGDLAFCNCTALSSITLPEGLTILGDRAFQGCTALTAVHIPSTLTSVTSSQGVFRDSGLRKVTFGDGITRIARGLFRNCGALTEITLPDTVTAIDEEAFNGCGSMRSVKLSDNLQSIGLDAFTGCGSLDAITLPDSLTSIGRNAFNACSALTSVTIPAGVSTWGDLAFCNCTALSSVTLPEGLSVVGGRTFQGCTALTAVHIPSTLTSVTSSQGVFPGSGLRKVTFGAGITRIARGLFRNCGALTEIPLPDTVTAIDEYAFYGCGALKSIQLPSGLTSIGWEAFSTCPSLTTVTIPASVTTWGAYVFNNCTGLSSVTVSEGLAALGSHTFNGCQNLRSILFEGLRTGFGDLPFTNCPQLTVYAPLRSVATTQAIDYQIPFHTTDTSSQDSSLYALDYGRSSLYADVNGMSANGYITLTVTYALKAQSGAAPSCLEVLLPSNAALDEETLRLNGAVPTGFSQDSRNLRLWTFPVTETSGALRMQVKVTGQGNLLGYARLKMRQNNADVYEVVGVLNEQPQLLTLDMPELTGEARFSLSGVAPASARVTLTVDGGASQTVTASKSGGWSAQITLDNPQDNTAYAVTASCPNGTETLTRTGSIVYQAGAPSLSGLEITYNQHGQTLHEDLMGGTGVKPKVYFMPRTEFRFDIEFQNPEQVETAYVTSTRNGEKKYLDAQYDAASGKFVAEGFFDPADHNYVPGKINVEYTPKRPAVNFTQEDLTAMAPQTGLSTNNVTWETKTEGRVTTTHAAVLTSGLSEELQGWVFDTTISTIDAAAGTDLDGFLSDLEELGEVVTFLQGGKELEVSISSIDDYEGYAVLIHNVSDKSYTKMIIDGLRDASGEGTLTNRGMAWLSDSLSTINKASGMLEKQYKLDKEVEDLREEILSNTSLTSAERAEAMSRLNSYAHDKGMFQIATAVLPVLVATAGATGGGAALVVFSGILGLMTATSSFFWDYRVGQIKGESLFVDWVVDPSGYVYDLETGERLQGVTATACWVPVEDDADLTEANKPAADVYGTPWNASEYEQNNPLLTNIDGKYQWDVPQGWWRVKYELTGYVTAWSDWLPVPPPQTEVNVGLTPVNASPYTAKLTTQSGSDAAIQVTRQSGGTGKLLFVAAAYDGGGRMTACRTGRWDLAAGGTASLTLPLSGGENTLRGFFLNPDTRAPLGRSWRVYLDQ